MRKKLCDDCRYSPMRQSKEPCHTGLKLGVYAGMCAAFRPTIGAVEHTWTNAKREGEQNE